MLTLCMGFFLIISLIWAAILCKRLWNKEELDSHTVDFSESFTHSNLVHDFKKYAVLMQLLPVGTNKEWFLHGIVCSQRVWSLPYKHGYNLYSSSMIIKASCKNLMNFMRKPESFGEWRPGVQLAGKALVSLSLQKLYWRQFNTSNRLCGRDNILCWWLEPLLQQELQVWRCFQSCTGYDWIVEQVGKQTTSLYVVQPVLGRENDLCKLTVITSGTICTMLEECACIIQYFQTARSPTEITSVDIKEPHHDDMVDPPGQYHNTNQNSSASAHVDKGASESASEGGQPSITHAQNAELSSNLSNMISNSVDGLSVSYGGAAAKVSLPDTPLSCAGEDFKRSNSTPLISAAKIVAAEGADSMTTPIVSPVQRTESVAGYSNVRFLRSPSQDKQLGLVDYKTLANSCAGDIMVDALESCNVLQRSKKQIEPGSSGWVFSNTERDVVALRKINPSNQRLQSWLGKGVIKNSPEEVWQALTNPYIRYLHDEMLKDLKILCDLGNGMKLVRLYYTTSQLLRKDAREFILLQAERIEDRKHTLTLCSVDWPEEEAKDCPRGKFKPSGWIIEPYVSKSMHNYSMVTYITQIDLGETETSGTQLFEDEFVTRQPNAIAELRDYLKSRP